MYIPEPEPAREIEPDETGYEVPAEEITRIIPDDEIEKYADENDKELARVINYFIRNDFVNLVGDDLFNIRENVLIDDFWNNNFYFEIDRIFQVVEDKYIAIITLPEQPSDEGGVPGIPAKQLLGLLEFPGSMGHGMIEKYDERTMKERAQSEQEDEDAIPVADVFLPENLTRNGYNLIHGGEDLEMSLALLVSREIEKFGTDYNAFFTGKSVYILLNRPVNLADARTMTGILMDINIENLSGTSFSV